MPQATLCPIGIYGGTYNPPHLGHFRAAAHARETLGLCKVLMIPTNIPPHKTLPEGSPTPAGRLELVRLGTRDYPGLEACDVELHRQGPSYTWQTLALLRARYPGRELVLLVGTDMFLSLLSWREPQSILAAASIGVFYRGEAGEQAAIEEQKQRLEALGARVYTLKNPVTTISSTQVRTLVRLGCGAEYLPPAVLDEILSQRLYGAGERLCQLPLDRLETEALTFVEPGRVRHVLGCRDTAVALAERWGADPHTAARAALLHDVTKALAQPDQLTLLRAYGKIAPAPEEENAQTIHALTGSLVAERIFGEAPAVVQAIAAHTTGKPGMDLLDSLLWLADYIEPTRSFPGAAEARALAFENWKQALAFGLQNTITHLRQKGRPVARATALTLAWLRSEKGNKL